MTYSAVADAVRSAVAALNDGDIDGYVRYFDPSCPRWAVGLAQPLTLTDIADNFRLCTTRQARRPPRRSPRWR